MSGDKQVNGKANGEDVDMKDTPGSKKPTNGKDEDEGIPIHPSKKTKSQEAGNGTDDDDETEEVTPVDPKEKAINGTVPQL